VQFKQLKQFCCRYGELQIMSQARRV